VSSQVLDFVAQVWLLRPYSADSISALLFLYLLVLIGRVRIAEKRRALDDLEEAMTWDFLQPVKVTIVWENYR
jgi:hypothetical protein